jgi:hypothetical protein
MGDVCSQRMQSRVHLLNQRGRARRQVDGNKVYKRAVQMNDAWQSTHGMHRQGVRFSRLHTNRRAMALHRFVALAKKRPMPTAWPQWLLAKANLLWRGYMYRPGPPEDFYDCTTGDVITRTELARTYGEELVRRVERVKGAPARKGLSIGMEATPPTRRASRT